MSARSVLVTGAASGIGLATVDRLRADGWTVSGLDRMPVPQGRCDRTVMADVRDATSVRDAVAELADATDGLHALVCCAGVSGSSAGDGPIGGLTAESFDAVVDINLRGATLVVAAAWESLLAHQGAVVLVSSVLGLTGGGGPFRSHAYVAAKGGLVALTRALAAEGRRDGLRVNCVAPGLVDTPMAERARSDPAVAAYVADRQPLTGGPIPPGAVAAAIAFLCSDDARAITGQVLPVDAGWGLDPT